MYIRNRNGPTMKPMVKAAPVDFIPLISFIFHLYKKALFQIPKWCNFLINILQLTHSNALHNFYVINCDRT